MNHVNIVAGSKIVAAEAILVSVPFTAHGSAVWNWGGATSDRRFDTLFVRLETDTGIVGWGEAFSRNQDSSLKRFIEQKIFPSIIGKDVSRINEIKYSLERELHNFGRVGPVGYGIGAVDIALWDICGKTANKPLVDLIGGRFVDEVEVYASLLKIGDAGLMREAVTEAIAKGYRSIKLHEVDLGVIRSAVEAAGPDIEVTLDVNCPWQLNDALNMDRALAPLKLGWLEEPVWPPENYGALAEVRGKGNNLIAAGENAGSLYDFVAMNEVKAIDIAQPDIAKVPGLTEMLRIGAYCDAIGVRLIPHCALFGSGMLATVHLNASRLDKPMLERLYMDFEADLFGDALEVRNGHVKVPRAPGLGRDPDPDVIKAYQVR